MKLLVLALAALAALLAPPAPASASEIIVLVHGLAGWGPDEMNVPALGHFYYWGQWFLDTSSGLLQSGDKRNLVKRLKAELTSKGINLPIYMATVGPVSANHERACELYAQIRGLRTDYGATRAALTQSQRYAPAGTSMDFSTKTAWLPNFGLNTDDRVHLIGHSMGAPTSRMLEYLMRFGKPDEAGTPGMSDLFRTDMYNVRRLSIRSIITVAGVNSGSTLHSLLASVQLGSGNLVDQVKNVLVGIATIDQAFTWLGGDGNSLYNFDLDRLGVITTGAPFNADAVFANPAFAPTYKYLAHYDLSPGFMYDFNTGGLYNNPNVYSGYVRPHSP